jgi:hypothetical protein
MTDCNSQISNQGPGDIRRLESVTDRYYDSLFSEKKVVISNSNSNTFDDLLYLNLSISFQANLDHLIE